MDAFTALKETLTEEQLRAMEAVKARLLEDPTALDTRKKGDGHGNA